MAVPMNKRMPLVLLVCNSMWRPKRPQNAPAARMVCASSSVSLVRPQRALKPIM